MIRSKSDYKYYLEQDKAALRVGLSRPRPFRDKIWRFQRVLRRVEYLSNCRGSIWGAIRYYYWLYRFKQSSIRLGFSIPPHVFGPGLSIAHRGTIVVNSNAKIGSNCRLHVCVNIGGKGEDVPVVGDNVYIGPGAKIFGKISIANGVAIGANSVVNKSVLVDNVTVAGVPARIVSRKGSMDMLEH